MRAVTYERYGGPDDLTISEVAKPAPRNDEVLVRVHAASINSWDWDMLVGSALGRIGGPIRPPHRILGADIAGIVEAVGRDVTRFVPGDAVMGDISESGWGGLAEYTCAREIFLTRKPDALSFEAAAAIPQAGSLALQGLWGKPQAGRCKRVLVVGAGGGMGSFAVQLAKLQGAEVTGVDRGEKLAFMRSLGADRAIDYQREDFAKAGVSFDFILDAVAHRSVFAYARALNPGGELSVVGGTIPALLQAGLLGPLISKRSGKTLGVLMWRPRAEDFATLADLAAEGEITPAVERVYALKDTAAAFSHLGAGRAKGKLVIRIG
ncbi:NAD(P)-dependent alcohol dehydrogenase [Pelagibacterium xiamenense]|uniref:NAD(P)-dependent alcohol dehydrogenase n=1 Tax=Pelagibacterium xiamenense TaxID=2901140 RepID=UPI001E3709EA|nr:NAD(P)-dependent alcohol dehydrogenase [Pelagibacterium xiamenense]MCD7059941.1 NAD(P)-dependent alcohol dehydrogenase [Pelagibacterium xiamenense]